MFRYLMCLDREHFPVKALEVCGQNLGSRDIRAARDFRDQSAAPSFYRLRKPNWWPASKQLVNSRTTTRLPPTIHRPTKTVTSAKNSLGIIMPSLAQLHCSIDRIIFKIFLSLTIRKIVTPFSRSLYELPFTNL